MTQFYAVFAYAIFFFFAIWCDNYRAKTRRGLLIATCVALTFMVGMRDVNVWSDTYAYVTTFLNINGIGELTEKDIPLGYGEMGFFYLTALIKSFTSNYHIFLTAISAITFYFLYKCFDRYSIYPLFAVAVYLSRFYCGRNMTQIRAALSIAIVIYFTFLLPDKKKRWWYLLVIFIAYHIHNSAIVALPLFLLRNYKIKSEFIVLGIIVSLILASAYGSVVKAWVQSSPFIMDMGGDYLREGSNKAFSNDLSNPVIWYQIFVLFAFTFYEKRLKNLTPYYYLMRNGYFYCTCILIVMCQYAIVAARCSTIFATFEIAMVPSLVNVLGKKNRTFVYVVLAVPYIILFALNWSPHYSN